MEPHTLTGMETATRVYIRLHLTRPRLYPNSPRCSIMQPLQPPDWPIDSVSTLASFIYHSALTCIQVRYLDYIGILSSARLQHISRRITYRFFSEL